MTHFPSDKWALVYHGTESLSFLGPKIWELVPSEIKQSKSLEIFKKRIKKWIPFQCPCRLCQFYLRGVEFTWKYTTIIWLFLDLYLRFFYFYFFTVTVKLVSTLTSPVNHYKVLVFLIVSFFVVYIFYCRLFVNNK